MDWSAKTIPLPYSRGYAVPESISGKRNFSIVQWLFRNPFLPQIIVMYASTVATSAAHVA